MFTVREILEATQGRLIGGSSQLSFPGISIDSRSINKGELFIAIKGKRFDGHNFIAQALTRGNGIVVSKDFYSRRLLSVKSKAAVFLVKDTLTALGNIASYHRNRFKGVVIGITGSTGKTTTKDVLTCILRQRYKVLKSRVSFNNFIGLPLTLFGLNSTHQMAVLEMGTSNIGEINRLAEIARPGLGVIINIGMSHLEGLQDIQNVYRAKLELLQMMGKDDLAMINGDDKKLVLMASYLKPRVITFGMNRNCDFRASQISYSNGGLNFLLNNRSRLRLKTLARHNIYNALAAIAVANQLGIDYDLIKKALASVNFPSGRMTLKRVCNIKLIDDSYNSNPLSLSSAVDTLARLSTSGRKILVSGDMLELGLEARDAHYRIGRKVAEKGIDILITVGKLAGQISRAAYRYGMKKGEIFDCACLEDVNCCLQRLARPGDVILVKGSRATGMERVVESFMKKLKKQIKD